MSSLNHERQMIWIMNWVEIQRGLDSVREAHPRRRPGSSPNSARCSPTPKRCVPPDIVRWTTNWPDGPVRKPTS